MIEDLVQYRTKGNYETESHFLSSPDMRYNISMAKGKAFTYDAKIAAMIWERIAISPIGLDSVLEILANEGVAVPSRSTWYKWLQTIPEMADNSARAREMQADFLAGLAVKHALFDREGKRIKTGPDGKEIITSDNVERSKLIYQALMKRAGQLNPKVYGDKTALTGSEGGPIEIRTLNDFYAPIPDKK